MVGVILQLRDLSKFASEVFDDLFKESSTSLHDLQDLCTRLKDVEKEVRLGITSGLSSHYPYPAAPCPGEQVQKRQALGILLKQT